MGHLETIPPADAEEEDEAGIRRALKWVGLLEAAAPRPNTPAYERLVDAAINYITQVVKLKERQGSSSDRLRRKYHDELCIMLLGKSRDELPKDTRDKVSNFAAYLTGHDDFMNTW